MPALPPALLLSHRDNVILRLGETFDLSCSSSNVNADFSLKWDFPPAAVREREQKRPCQSRWPPLSFVF